MRPTKLISLAERSLDLHEELVETLLNDIITQLDGLDPSNDGDELLEIIKETLDEPEDNELTVQLLGYLLGCSVEDWLEEFVAE